MEVSVMDAAKAYRELIERRRARAAAGIADPLEVLRKVTAENVAAGGAICERRTTADEREHVRRSVEGKTIVRAEFVGPMDEPGFAILTLSDGSRLWASAPKLYGEEPGSRGEGN